MARRMPKVLIFEDDSLTAYANKTTLEDGGYKIIGIANEAISGLLLAEFDHPDIALVDVDIDGSIDGITVARALRDAYGTRIVFLTAQPGRVLSEGVDLHRFGVIGKPYNGETLLETMRETLSHELPDRAA